MPKSRETSVADGAGRSMDVAFLDLALDQRVIFHCLRHIDVDGAATYFNPVTTDVDSSAIMAGRKMGFHPNIAFGLALLDIIRAMNVTQQELARRVGVSENTVCRWCTGRFRPSRAVQQLLLDAVATAPRAHVHALARSMLADPTVTYPEGVNAPSMASVPRTVTDAARAAIDAQIRRCAVKLGAKPGELRLMFGSLLSTIVSSGVDVRTARAIVNGA
jgi:transcriptional regulator with XRE-family HTH domain